MDRDGIDDPLVSLIMDMPEDVIIIDLPRCWLLPAGIVSYLEIRDLVPCKVDIGNQVPLLDLLMIEVVKDLVGWIPHGFANAECLRDLFQEEPGMIPEIQRLEPYDQSMRFQDPDPAIAAVPEVTAAAAVAHRSGGKIFVAWLQEIIPDPFWELCQGLILKPFFLRQAVRQV